MRGTQNNNVTLRETVSAILGGQRYNNAHVK